ncbi:hypothetical protein GGQ74_001334 [Desulfobaculum xiamenense]|uniref:DinB-like domain-containing protein n=1 Tax=Desulfobaculum xiamenense TaxID=995050 RepID=A0A846QR66_9BACT|nr:DinB family protein [Desulfobaculum xiamenense]NJB67694.1 hypothetical protein [Desulfobaculum xiamenense]
MQNELSIHDACSSIISVLHECIGGAEESGAFLEPGPHGLLHVLDAIDAEQASRPSAGASVATHALHVAFSLDVFLAWIRGNNAITPDWTASWAQSAVTEEEWKTLRSRIAIQASQLEAAIAAHAPADAKALWGALGALAHTAFHLGCIQIKVDALLDADSHLELEKAPHHPT